MDFKIKREKRKQKKMFNQHPLGLPKGSIRAIIAISLTILLSTCIALEHEIPMDIGIVWISFISYYVGHRTN